MCVCVRVCACVCTRAFGAIRWSTDAPCANASRPLRLSHVTVSVSMSVRVCVCQLLQIRRMVCECLVRNFHTPSCLSSLWGMCVCAHKCVRVCVCLCVDIHTYIYNFHTPSHISRRPSPLHQRVAALSHCLTSKVHTYSAQGGNELCFKHNIQSIISNVNCAHRFCTWRQCIIFKNEYPIYYI